MFEWRPSQFVAGYNGGVHSPCYRACAPCSLRHGVCTQVETSLLGFGGLLCFLRQRLYTFRREVSPAGLRGLSSI